MIKKFNELKTTTYLSAANKAKSFNQMERSKRIIDYVFYKFIGKELNDSKIKKVVYGGTNSKTIIISTESDMFVYLIDKDLISENPIIKDRRSANLLSKIILTANPESKYKNVNYMRINGY